MTESTQKILREALSLSVTERAVLIEELVSSLHQLDPDIDELWAQEAEDRLNAYRAGKIHTSSEEEIFEEFKNV